jgi:DNA topoisomerase VI subunit B
VSRVEWQVAVNNTSFDRVGITKDCKEAISEYIWNGYEAGATKVEVKVIGTPLKEAMAIQVVDNGNGIEFETLGETFKAFLSTNKNLGSIRIKSQSNKGKGRFSYLCFSNSAQWSTVYEKDGGLKSYAITMNSANKRNFSTSDVVEVADVVGTGTIVEFPIAESNTMDQLSYANIKQKLLQEFSWYLYF